MRLSEPEAGPEGKEGDEKSPFTPLEIPAGHYF